MRVFLVVMVCGLFLAPTAMAKDPAQYPLCKSNHKSINNTAACIGIYLRKNPKGACADKAMKFCSTTRAGVRSGSK